MEGVCCFKKPTEKPSAWEIITGYFQLQWSMCLLFESSSHKLSINEKLQSCVKNPDGQRVDVSEWASEVHISVSCVQSKPNLVPSLILITAEGWGEKEICAKRVGDGQ